MSDASAKRHAPKEAKLLLRQYQEMHEQAHFQGIGCLNFYREIQRLVERTHARTLLDYGCGKGRQFRLDPLTLHSKLGVYVESWREVLNVDSIQGYDPAYPPYARVPEGQFDGVYCCSVLEHLLESQLTDTLHRIFSYARKFVFFAVGTQPAKKSLPDGRNAHISLHPVAWWLGQVARVACQYPEIEWQLMEERGKEIDDGK